MKEKHFTTHATLRLDVWLWYARFFKSRSQASAACEAGMVTCNGWHANKKTLIKQGDKIGFSDAHARLPRRFITVFSLGIRRGPASEAALLYKEEDHYFDNRQEDETS